MTERRYTVDEIRRWANNPNTALFGALAAESAAASAAAAGEFTASELAGATSAVPDRARKSSMSPSARAEGTEESTSTDLASALALLRHHLGRRISGLPRSSRRLRPGVDGGPRPSRQSASVADSAPHSSSRSGRWQPTDVDASLSTSAQSVKADSPAAGRIDDAPAAATGLTFSLSAGRVTVLFEPGVLDPAEVIAAVSSLHSGGGRP